MALTIVASPSREVLMGTAYKTISKTDFQYDAQGNETQGKSFSNLWQ